MRLAREIAERVDAKIAEKGCSEDDLRNQVKGRVILDGILREMPKPHRLKDGYPPRRWNGILLFVKAMVFTLENFRCIYCTLPADSLDHVVPASKHGPFRDKGEASLITNLVTSCRACNTAKWRRSLDDYIMKVKNDKAVEYAVFQSQIWMSENRHYAELQKQAAKGLETFEKDRSHICKELQRMTERGAAGK